VAAASLALVLVTSCERARQAPGAVIARTPQVSEQTATAVTALPALGFTTGIVTHSDASVVRAALDAAQRVGIRLLVGDPRLLARETPFDSALAQAERLVHLFAAHPACGGYCLGTLGDTTLFSRAAALQGRITSRDRLHTVIVGLSGYGPDPAQRPSRYSLRTHEAFVSAVRPSILYFDQQGIESGGPAADFFANLSTVRRMALTARLPWWGVVFAPRGSEEPSPRDNHLRFQAMALLAHGAVGLEYVLDWTTLQAWSAMRGPLPPVARTVAEVNATFAAWSPILSRSTCTAVYHSDPVPAGGEPLTLEGVVYRIDGEYITVALFRGKRTRELYAMVVNRNYNRGAKPRLYFSGQVKGLEEVTPADAVPLVVHFSPREGSHAVSVLLKAGGGRLFRLLS
jgi:hypothetical protein